MNSSTSNPSVITKCMCQKCTEKAFFEQGFLYGKIALEKSFSIYFAPMYPVFPDHFAQCNCYHCQGRDHFYRGYHLGRSGMTQQLPESPKSALNSPVQAREPSEANVLELYRVRSTGSNLPNSPQSPQNSPISERDKELLK